MALNQVDFTLYVGKETPKKADAGLLRALQSVEVMQADDSSDAYRQGFQLTFNAERKTSAASDYEHLVGPDLSPGNRVIVVVNLNGTPKVLMDGIITHQQLAFETGEGTPLLVIMGKDLSILMDLEEKHVGYGGMKLKDVVGKILKGYASYGIKAKITTPSIEWPTQPAEHMPFQTGTDLDYLRSLAAANGYIFNIQAGPRPKQSIGYWGPPVRTTAPRPALTLNMGSHTSVDKLDFAYDALAPTKTRRMKAGNQPTVDEVKASKIGPDLAKKPALSSNGAFVRRQWMAYAGPDEGEAAARAQAMVDTSAETVVSAKGALTVTKYGDLLTAPGLVGVRGVGMTYDGEYYIKSVKHIINAGSYTQEFTLGREGVMSTKQRVKA